jgi:tripartite-type tricarboxylate transporter receptor subunit TctC
VAKSDWSSFDGASTPFQSVRVRRANNPYSCDAKPAPHHQGENLTVLLEFLSTQMPVFNRDNLFQEDVMRRRTFIRGAGSLALGTLLGRPTFAQQFPTKTVHLVVPFEPGGTSDILARLVAVGWGNELGQSVIVENKSGANSIIGTNHVARSKPDGYTALLGTTANASNATLHKSLPYDSLKDISPVTPIALTPYFLIARGDLPANSVQDLIELARKRPGEISFASAGIGGTPHLTGEMFAYRTGLKLLHVPYRGTAPALQDVVAGRADFMFTGLVTAQPFLESKKLKVLAAAGESRSAFAPHIPMISEAGVPGVIADSWFAILLPAGVPDEVEVRLDSSLRKVLQTPAFKNRLAELGGELMPHTRQEFKKLYADDIAKWAEIIKVSGAKAE